MPKFNISFDLTVQDIDLIESALRTHKKTLSLERLALLDQGAAPQPDDLARLDATLGALNALLGRLHNQKIFYRPKAGEDAPYISG